MTIDDREILHSLKIGYSLTITFFILSLKCHTNVFRVFSGKVNIYNI